MLEAEMGHEREHRNSEIIRKAVESLDAYDSPRAVAANAVRYEGQTYPVKLPDRKLTFMGMSHTNNPDSPEIGQLRDDMRELMSTVAPEKVVFMVEGWNAGMDSAKAAQLMEGVASEKEAVKKTGESGVVFWEIAERKNQGIEVEIVSPEKPEHEIIKALKADGFTPDELSGYLAIRQMTNVFRKGRDKKSAVEILDNLTPDFYDQQQLTGVDWIKDIRLLEDIKKLPTDALHEYKLKVMGEYIVGLNDWMKKTGVIEKDIVSVEALLEQDGQKASMKDINELQNPLDFDGRRSRINAVSARWNGERDKYLVEQIGKAMAAGKKPYVIYGASHATHLEPALHQLASIE